MGKTSKVVVCGSAGVGKTAILEQLIHGTHIAGEPLQCGELEDTYVAHVETDRGVREKVRFYDLSSDPLKPELHKHYVAFADGFVLVYDVTNAETFKFIDRLKKEIDRHKDKRELTIVVLGNKADLVEQQQQRLVDLPSVHRWVNKEKLYRHFETTVTCRQTLIDAFVALTSKITQPQSKSSFPFGKKEQKN